MKTINVEFQNEKVKNIVFTVFKIVITLLFIVWNLKASAQDTIVMKNFSFVLVKVTEVSTEEVKYIKIDNINGPIYSKKLYEISKIKYQNGVIENYNMKEPIMLAKKNKSFEVQKEMRIAPLMMNEKDMFLIMQDKKNPEINSLIRQTQVSKGLKNIGFGAIPCAAIASVAYVIGAFEEGFNGSMSKETKLIGGASIAVGTICLSTSIYFGANEKVQKKKAVSLYNELYATGY